MNRITCGICILVMALLLAAPAMAQTYDITDYMMLTPGQYMITEGEDPCSGGTWQDATVCSTKDQYTLQTWYGKEGAVWEKEGVDILEVTDNYAIYHGQYDYSPGEEGFWLLSPPIKIPRSLELNQIVVSSGVSTHDSTSVSYAHTFMITEAGVTVTTPDGVFNNCLKLIESYLEETDGESRIMIWAPGMGEVKTWTANVEDDGGDIYLENAIDQIIDHGSF